MIDLEEVRKELSNLKAKWNIYHEVDMDSFRNLVFILAPILCDEVERLRRFKEKVNNLTIKWDTHVLAHGAPRGDTGELILEDLFEALKELEE